MQQVSLIAATTIAVALLFGGHARAQGEPKSAAAVQEVQTALRELGYLRATPSGKWEDPLTDAAVKFFLKDADLAWDAAASGADLFILRNALRAEVTRRKPDAVNLFVAADYESSYRLQVLISADGERALTAEQSSLLLWDVRNRLQIAPLKRKCCLDGVALSSDGTLVAYSLKNGFPLRDGIGVTNVDKQAILLQSELPKSEERPEAHLIRFLPSNRGLLIGDTTARLIFQDIDASPARIVGEHLPGVKNASIYGRMLGLDVSPDGRYAATITSYDGQVKIWDIAAGRLVRSVSLYKPTTGINDKGELKYDNPILVAFDSAGRTAIVAAPGVNRINRIDIASGAVTSVDPGGSIVTAVASPKRDVIALSISRSKEQVASGGNRPLGGGPWPRSAANESAMPQNSIDVYELDNLRLLGRVATVNKIWAITDFGRTALVGQSSREFGGDRLAAADLVAGKFTPFARTNQRMIPDIALDEKEGVVHLGVQEDRELRMLLASGEITGVPVSDPAGETSAKARRNEELKLKSVALSPDGMIIDASAARIDEAANVATKEEDKGYIIQINPQTGLVSRKLVQASAPLESAFSPRATAYRHERSRAATAFEREHKDAHSDAFISIVDTAGGREQSRIKLIPLTREPVFPAALHRCQGQTCLTRRLNDGFPAREFARRAPVSFSATGRLVYAGFWEPAFAAYDADTGRQVATFNSSLDFKRYRPNARLGPRLKEGVDWEFEFAANFARTLSVPRVFAPVPGTDEIIAVLGQRFMLHFRPGSPNPTRVVEIPGSPQIAVVAPDASKVALGYRGGLVLVVDAVRGTVLAELTGQRSDPTKLEFSTNGKRLYSRATDGTFTIWNVETGRLLTTTYLFDNGEWLTITPEGFFAASTNGAGALLLRRGGLTVVTVDQVFQALYRPDLVREKLAGDPQGLVREAAARLDLPKVLASGSAPVLTLASPRDWTRATAEQVTGEVEIANRGGGIGRIEWRINGVTVAVDAAPAAAAAGQPLRLTRTLALDEGDNEIEVVGYNAQNLLASVPARASVTGAATGRTPARLYVLAVGLNEYADRELKLSYAVPDAKALAEALGAAGKGLYEAVEVTLVEDAAVNRERLAASFAALAHKVRPTDVFAFFIAGHGKTVDGRYYFIPRDFRRAGERITQRDVQAQGIAQEEWQAWFAGIPARKSMLIFDTCESGTLTGATRETELLARGAANDRLAQATGRSILTASSGSADALEGYRGHGLFTYNLLEALERADGDGNGTIEVAELATYVYAAVTALSVQVFKERQEPQIRITANYAFAKPTRVLPEAAPGMAIPVKPTHRTAAATELLVKPSLGARRVRKLDASTPVTLVNSTAGWTLVARDAKVLGYVASKDLAPLN